MSLARTKLAPRRISVRVIAALIAAGSGWLAQAAPGNADSTAFAVSDAWMRLTIPQRPAVGYFTLTNKTGADAELIGASSPGCATMALHETLNQAGVESMRTVASVRILAHGSVRFAPGGYHLMCMAPSTLLAAGQRVPVTLKLAGGNVLTVDFVVRGIPRQ